MSKPAIKRGQEWEKAGGRAVRTRGRDARACEFCGDTEEALNAGGAQLYECEVKNCGRLCCADCSTEGTGREAALDVAFNDCGDAP